MCKYTLLSIKYCQIERFSFLFSVPIGIRNFLENTGGITGFFPIFAPLLLKRKFRDG